MLGNKISLSNFKKTEIISRIFSKNNETRNQQQEKKTAKSTNTWRLNNMLLNDKWVTEEIKQEIKKYLETNENGNIRIQNLCDPAKAVLR